MNIEISTQRLDADISKMQDGISDLSNSMNQVYRCLEALNTMWDGSANAAFVNQTRMDQILLTDLIKNLNDLVECMEYARGEYNRCNEDVNYKIAGIRLSNDT